MKPHGCRDMTAEECATAMQLYLDGALLRQVAAETRRHATTIEKLLAGAGLKRGHRFRTKGRRAYLAARVAELYGPGECDCQMPETTAGGFAAVSVGCPIHGDAGARTLESTM